VRVAVVEPFPRVSGVTAYAWHALDGFRAAGCDADLITFTKSGKSRAHTSEAIAPKGGWQWWSKPVDVTASWKEASALLDTYDLVLLDEVKCLPLDKIALRAMEGGDLKRARERVLHGDVDFEELPPYIQAIADLKHAKWAAVMHAPQYQFSKAPLLSRFLHNVPPGLLVCQKPGALESADWTGENDHDVLFYPYLPYTLRSARLRESWPRVAGAAGRFITNKGLPTLAAITDLLPAGWDSELWGAGPAGAGANHTFLCYEGLVTQLGFEGYREGQNVTGDSIGNRGDVLGAWKWSASKFTHGTGKHTCSYMGGYTERDDIYSRLGVYVNFTDPDFCGKGNEYTHLEAMDSGCVAVVGDSCQPVSAKTYDAVSIEPFSGPLTLGASRGTNFFSRPGEREVAQHLADAVAQGCSIAEDPALAAVYAERCREEVTTLNSPLKWAESVLHASV